MIYYHFQLPSLINELSSYLLCLTIAVIIYYHFLPIPSIELQFSFSSRNSLPFNCNGIEQLNVTVQRSSMLMFLFNWYNWISRRSSGLPGRAIDLHPGPLQPTNRKSNKRYVTWWQSLANIDLKKYRKKWELEMNYFPWIDQLVF